MCTIAPTSGTKSQLESAMDSLVEVFHFYASTEGDKFKLNRRELGNLLRGELRSYIEVSWDSRQAQEILDDLDKNRDGTVSFEEFIVLVTRLTVCSVPFFRDYTPMVIYCG